MRDCQNSSLLNLLMSLTGIDQMLRSICLTAPSSRGFVGLCNKRALLLDFQEKPIKDLFAVVFQYESSLGTRINGVCQSLL